MGWNGSGGKTPVAVPKARPRKGVAVGRGLVAGVIVAVGGLAVWWMLSGGGESGADAKPRRARTVKDVSRPGGGESSAAKSEGAGKPSAREERLAALQDEIRQYIRKSPTNNVIWTSQPLAPDDPDRAIYTRLGCELAALIAVRPGEQPIPFPYSFMDEDEAKRRAEAEGKVAKTDNGNAAFKDALGKFRIAAKATDGEDRLAFKEKMIGAQMELISSLDEGLSVNDAIRAAYEFRVRAYETRNAAIETMSGFLAQGDSVEDTKEILAEMNAKFDEEGIKRILPEEIGIEEPEGEGQQEGKGTEQ